MERIAPVKSIDDARRGVDGKHEEIRSLTSQAAEIEKKKLALHSSREEVLIRDGADVAGDQLDAHDRDEKLLDRQLHEARLRIKSANAELATLTQELAAMETAEKAAAHRQEAEHEMVLVLEDAAEIRKLIFALAARMGVFERRRFRLQTEFVDVNGNEASIGAARAIGIPRGHIHNALASQGWGLPPVLPGGGMLVFSIVGQLPPVAWIVSLEELEAEKAAAFEKLEPEESRSQGPAVSDDDRPRSVFTNLIEEA